MDLSAAEIFSCTKAIFELDDVKDVRVGGREIWPLICSSEVL